ncbi:hypothetical protein ACLOJK_005618 [Asimina triloba]
MGTGFCSPPPLPLSFPSPLSLPPSPLSLPTLSFPSPSRSPLSPFPSPSRCPPGPLSLLAVADSSFPPLAVVDSPFPSPSRCPPLPSRPSPSRYPSLPSRHRRLVVSLSLSLPPSGSPLPVCRPWLPATSIAVAHPPTHPPSLLFYFSPISFVSSPSFGRKTALKLLRKHGSLENLLQAATIRTVGKQYAQDALTKHADYLRKNYEVLSLRRDVDVHLEEKWLSERDTSNDSAVLSNFMKELGQSQKLSYRNASISG